MSLCVAVSEAFSVLWVTQKRQEQDKQTQGNPIPGALQQQTTSDKNAHHKSRNFLLLLP
jgi:hypothetical protein